MLYTIGHSENTIILFACPPKFYISIVFVFSRHHCKAQEKLETMLMQNFGGQTKSIMVFSEVAYSNIPGVQEKLKADMSNFFGKPNISKVKFAELLALVLSFFFLARKLRSKLVFPVCAAF